MKNITVLLLTLVMILTLFSATDVVPKNINVDLNGEQIQSDVPPITQNDKGPTHVTLKKVDLNILVKQNIISQEDLNKDITITNLEALKTIDKITTGNNSASDGTPNLSEWYKGNTLEPLDYLDDDCKSLILDLLRNGNTPIITCDDVLAMRFDANITNYEALTYITRMIGDTYCCFDSPIELTFKEKGQTYKAAYEKGIIDNIDMKNSDLPIARKDFYAILCRALFVERSIGGYAPTTGRYIDSIVKRNKNSSQPKKETIINTNVIEIIPVTNDDMSISWTMPVKYQYFKDYEFFTDILAITDDGVIKNYSTSCSICVKINTTEIIQMIAGAYPTKLSYIRVEYSKYNNGYKTKDEYYFDIDISNITAQIEGKEISPGVYTRYKKQWVPESISLAKGQLFKENTYYLLTSYDHTYRNSKYNIVSRAIFMTNKTSNEFTNPTHSQLGVGGIKLDEIHIQEIIINGTAASGFTVSMTPASKEIFKVVEG